jgi:hypothetical protein
MSQPTRIGLMKKPKDVIRFVKILPSVVQKPKKFVSIKKWKKISRKTPNISEVLAFHFPPNVELSFCLIFS